MNNLSIFIIDSFTESAFRGNPAAVCPLDAWLPDVAMQAIARENNVPETAFFVPTEAGYDLRWFTPELEVPLCGHATLAAAFVLFTKFGVTTPVVAFKSASGMLSVTKNGKLLSMDFPAISFVACAEVSVELSKGLGIQPLEIFRADADPNYYAIYKNEDEIALLRPNMPELASFHPYGVVVSARGKRSDCVTRYFAPSYGIPEDPVTGSVHCVLAPYWASKLNETKIKFRQLSRRGGELTCEVLRDRVIISGCAVLYSEGEIVCNLPGIINK